MNCKHIKLILTTRLSFLSILIVSGLLLASYGGGGGGGGGSEITGPGDTGNYFPFTQGNSWRTKYNGPHF